MVWESWLGMTFVYMANATQAIAGPTQNTQAHSKDGPL